MREVKIGEWLKEGYEAVKTDFANYILPMLIIVGVSLTVIGVVLLGPLFSGFYYIIFQRMKGKSATTGDLFKGFEVLWDSLLGWIVILGVTFLLSLVPFFGFILSLLAGAPFIFVLPLIIEKKIFFLAAIKESLLLFREKWSELIPFYVIGSLVGISGLLILGIGIVFTFPIYLYATACLYRDWIGLQD